MDIEKFLNSKETYDKVVDILSKKVGPSTIDSAKEINGFIAGGSVSNILYSMVHGGKPIIRDVDIFHLYEKNADFEWVESDMGDFNISLETGLSIDGDWYGNRWVQPNGDFSIMKSHTRDGDLNFIEVYVNVKWDRPYETVDDRTQNFTTDKKNVILRGFDLNCCQAGLDVDNQKIIYTDDFLDFLKTQQLLVTIPVNPVQTVIRILKKSKDLKCYCDFKSEFKLLQHASIYTNKVASTFGEETYQKYLECKEEVDSIFNIVKAKKLKTESTQLISNTAHTINKSLSEDIDLWVFEPKINEYEVKYYFSHPLHLVSWWRINNNHKRKKRKIQRVINYIIRESKNKKVERRQDPIVSKKPIEEKFLFESGFYENQGLYGFSKLKDKDICTINHWLWFYMMKKDVYNCDFSTEHLRYMDYFFNEHSRLQSLLLGKEWDIQEIYNFIKFIKSKAKQKGEWVIGELENITFEDNKDFYSTKNKYRWLNDFIIKCEERLGKQLVTPLDLGGFEYKDCITELTTPLELKTEGKKMGHCVGGYSNSLENGMSRIFHIECDGIGSTIEINVSNYYSWNYYDNHIDIPDGWESKLDREDLSELREINKKINSITARVNQHHGRYPEKGNLTPTEKNIEIGYKLIDFINQNVLNDKLGPLLLEKYYLELKLSRKIKSNKVKDDFLF